jgi:hypothetical protein
VPTTPLPDRPDLDQLRRRARELQRAADVRSSEALDLLREHLGGPPPIPLPLHLAQLALARLHGFPSWPRLVAQVRVLEEFRSDPAGAGGQADSDPAETVLRDASLLFGPDDGPQRWARAARRLAEQPGLATNNALVAAAVGNRAALRDLLATDPGAARRAGPPFGWPPLLHLTYSRLTLAGVPGDAAGCMALLLAAGVDPDSGFLWQGLPTPFTALTGLLGSSTPEQPVHPEAEHLVPALLRAGADPNDAQGLYNRMFTPDDRHLELLLPAGLGRGDGGSWRRRLPDLSDTPAQLLSGQLAWAVVHGFARRVRLLASAGVDLDRPLDVGRLPLGPGLSPLALAQRSGRADMADLLVGLGAAADSDPESEVLDVLLRGDRARLAALAPDLPRLRPRHPSLVLRAAVADSSAGVRLAVELGFDVNALGRQDVPLEQPWETALHHAAGEGKLELAVLLLELGADPDVRDTRYAATPLSWATHLGQPALVALLTPLTREA